MKPGDTEWRDVHYGAEGIPEVMTNLRTTATVIIIWEDWFDDANTTQGRGPGAADGHVQPGVDPSRRHPHHAPERPGGAGRAAAARSNRAIVIWDKVGGGLGLSKAVADNLGRYTQALLEIARQPGPRSERERLLREDTAAALHRWAAAVAPHTLGPEQIPVITEYGGTTFRSQLEARWAAYFDRQGIAWEYEPAQFDGWTPDFRLGAGRRGDLRRGQAGERVSHGRGPANAELRLDRRHPHPGTGAAPRLALPTATAGSPVDLTA